MPLKPNPQKERQSTEIDWRHHFLTTPVEVDGEDFAEKPILAETNSQDPTAAFNPNRTPGDSWHFLSLDGDELQRRLVGCWQVPLLVRTPPGGQRLRHFFSRQIDYKRISRAEQMPMIGRPRVKTDRKQGRNVAYHPQPAHGENPVQATDRAETHQCRRDRQIRRARWQKTWRHRILHEEPNLPGTVNHGTGNSQAGWPFNS
jgi:hypothetical protein